MGYIDLIPDIFRLTMPSLATAKSYHTQKFNVGNKCCIGVTIKASQALSVAVAYGIVGDTAAAAGVDVSGTLPYKTSATSFASSTGTEGGTYHELAIPPHARQAQLVISNASGSTVSGAVIDAALRVVAYPASGIGGNLSAAEIAAALDAGSGTAAEVVRGDGTISALGATDTLGEVAALTTGNSGAFLVADTRLGSPTPGLGFRVRFHTFNNPSPTLSLNGSAAEELKLAGYVPLLGGEWGSGAVADLVYTSLGWIIEAHSWALAPSEIPNLSASKIASGTFATARIPGDLGRTNITDSQVPVANTTFTTVRTVSVSPCLVDVFVVGVGAATLFWDGSTLSVWKSLADTNIVAAASANSGEVAWRMSGTSLQASNNTGSSKNCYAGLARR